MRIFITAIFSLLALTVPIVIDATGLHASIALAGVIEALQTATNPMDSLVIPIIQFFGSFLITIGAFLLWLAGILFNYGVQYGILEFATFANISGIPTAWAMLRDLTNIFFIFIFLAIGIGTILGTNSIGSPKLLPKLLIIAVLVNFSLFFSKVGIDVAHAFAGAILNQSGVVAADNCVTGSCRITYGPATAFLEQFGFVDLFGTSANQALAGGATASGVYAPIFSADTLGLAGRALLFGLVSFIFMTIAAMVLFGGALILIIRIVKLLLLMISAAPAMAAMILPNTKKYWDVWLENFIKEAVYAPTLLLLLAISLLFLNTARNTFGTGSANTSFADIFINGSTDSASLIIFFLISVGFLFMSIKVAGMIGGMGAATVQKFASRRVGALAGGAVAIAGRNTIGRGAAAASAGIKNSEFGRSTFGRLITTQGFDKVANASLDPRAAISKNAQKTAGLDLGTPLKSYNAEVKERAGKFAAYQKDLGNTLEERGEKRGLELEAEQKKKELKDKLTTATPEAIAAAEARLTDASAALEAATKEREAIDKEFATKLQYATPQERASIEKEHAAKIQAADQNLAQAKETLSQANTTRANLQAVDVKAINAEIKQIDEALKQQKKEIEQRPQREYVENLRGDVVGKIKQLELTDAAAEVERKLAKLSKQIDSKVEEVKKETNETVKESLRRELAGLTQSLDEVREEQNKLKIEGNYQKRTGPYKVGAVGILGTDAASKLAAASAIEKELKKGDDKKNLDTLVSALKESSDKKDDK